MFEKEMTRTFIQTNEFVRQWKKLGFAEENLRQLELMIMHNPEMTGGLRKMRFAYKGRGKSGSTRVCYVDFAYCETVYLITAYAKNQKDNLSKEERNSIKKAIEFLESEVCHNNNRR